MKFVPDGRKFEVDGREYELKGWMVPDDPKLIYLDEVPVCIKYNLKQLDIQIDRNDY